MNPSVYVSRYTISASLSPLPIEAGRVRTTSTFSYLRQRSNCFTREHGGVTRNRANSYLDTILFLHSWPRYIYDFAIRLRDGENYERKRERTISQVTRHTDAFGTLYAWLDKLSMELELRFERRPV